jgi:putative ABC transport system substrate-binding protein
MRRRNVIGGLSAAPVLPFMPTTRLAADQVRRIGWVEAHRERGPPSTSNWSEVAQQLRPLGWTRGGNLQADIYVPTQPAQIPTMAQAAVGARPDLIVTTGTPATLAVLAQTRTLPVLFFEISDPIGNGIVRDLAHPGGNVTGFTTFEPTLTGKWLQLLRELDPKIRRVAILCNPETAPNRASPFVREFEAIAASLSIEPILAYAKDIASIALVVAALAAEPGGALLVLPDEFTLTYRHTIVNLTAHHRVPAIYGTRFAVTTGGLISYGPTTEGLHRGLATYIDRILRGTKPRDLPVQAPVTYSLIVNLRTAKALDLPIPPTILAAADEVIDRAAVFEVKRFGAAMACGSGG